MSEADHRELSVLRHKREATRYRVLVEIAARQPAVSQREIADAIGVTAQAVSEYVGELADLDHVEKEGRGRYRITKEGVDWLLSRTDELQAFTTYVAEEVVGGVDVEAAVATEDVEADELVALSMREGVLHATPGVSGRATAVAVTAASAGEAVGVSEFEGLLDYEPGVVTVVALPAVADDDGGGADHDEGSGADDDVGGGADDDVGSGADDDVGGGADDDVGGGADDDVGGGADDDVGGGADHDELLALADDHALVAVAGVEALTAVRAAGLDPDVRFGTVPAVEEAAARGLDVLLVAIESAVSAHTDRLREGNLRYEVVDAAGSG